MCSASAPHPAAGFDDSLAGLQPKLAADQIHLRHLRVLERRVGTIEVGAGVEELSVEPARVEVVSQVVVVMRSAAIAGDRSRAAPAD